MESGADVRLLADIHALEERVQALEFKRAKKPAPTAPRDAKAKTIEEYAVPASDAFAVSMNVKALAVGLKRIRFVRCAVDYYSWTLELRRRYLSAPSALHLCKSIVMCNTYWSGDELNELDRFNSRYYCCVVSYDTKLSASDISRIIKDLNKAARRVPPTNKELHFRLADDCEGVTGFCPNAVTPVGLKTPMPIVLDKVLTTLDPPMFWMGGGEVNLKLAVDTQEFIEAFNPIIGTVSV
jgi:prolyl-tRNA editing enzyme YbaK/EbsC (Cys-tRNA(Pro) deacylase)